MPKLDYCNHEEHIYIYICIARPNLGACLLLLSYHYFDMNKHDAKQREQQWDQLTLHWPQW